MAHHSDIQTIEYENPRTISRATVSFSQSVKIMLESLDTALDVLAHPHCTDVINECPPSVISLLSTRPDILKILAHTKLHTYHYASVPTCWRRLYTDTSIIIAIKSIKRILLDTQPNGESSLGEGQDEAADEEKICEVIRMLDMAIIMAGAEGRRELIDDILTAFESHVKKHQSPQTKRRKLEDAFPMDLKADNAAPIIRHPIPSISDMSLATFNRYLEVKSMPLMIKGALTHWPAFDERPWNPNYLMERTFGGRRLIPVEVGRSYTDEGWGQSIITFREFMNKYLLNEEVGDRSKLGYLAQYDLFSQIPLLRNDISIPDYCYADIPATRIRDKREPGEALLNAWFGPAGTVSPLHTDPYHNILCQVAGKKYIRLYSPEFIENVYPRGIQVDGVNMSNTSEVDVEAAPDQLDARFPLFREARYVETILNEGECLYIPVGWWHYVRSLTVSFSVSFWFI